MLWHYCHHPKAKQPEATRTLQSWIISGAQPSRAVNQSAQTVPTGGNTVRKVWSQLLGNANDCCYSSLALSSQTRPIDDKAIGVLAVFSHQSLELEFLEVLQTLCTICAIALDTAMQHQKEKQAWQVNSNFNSSYGNLCDRLVTILSATRLTLIGTEKPLTLSVSYVFLQTAEILKRIECNYCRLIYSEDTVSLEAIVPILTEHNPQTWIESCLSKLFFIASYLGGSLQTQPTIDGRAMQVVLKIPYTGEVSLQQLQIKCCSPVLQLAFTHLCFLAGVSVSNENDNVPLLTDDITQISAAKQVIWIDQLERLPKGIKAKVDLSITPAQLRCCVESVVSGKFWGIETETREQNLSDRELEILTLLTQGKRDRDIAKHLIISESTVKFHINNVLVKLKAKTRCQVIACAIVNGWI